MTKYEVTSNTITSAGVRKVRHTRNNANRKFESYTATSIADILQIFNRKSRERIKVAVRH